MKLKDRGIRISLLKVRPGVKDEDLWLGLERWAQREQLPWLKTLVSLGSFDAIVVAPLESAAEAGPEEIHPIDLGGLAVAWNGFYGYQAVDDGSADLLQTLEGPVVLVSALKISDQLLADHGVDAVSGVAEFINEFLAADTRLQSVTVGTFGWHDLVLLQSGSDVDAMVNRVLELRKVSASQVPSLASSRGAGLLLETSFSTLAVPRAIFETLLAPGDEAAASPSTSARITIVAQPGQFQAAARLVPTYFPSADLTKRNPLGKGDAILQVDGPFLHIVRQLLRFRRDLGSILRETDTVVEATVGSDPAPSSQAPSVPHIEQLLVPDLSALASQDYRCYSAVAITCALVAGLLSQPLDADSYSDLVPVMRRLLDYLGRDPDRRPINIRLSQACELLDSAIRQRHLGSYSGLLESPSYVSFQRFEGGLQKIYAALNELAVSALTYVDGGNPLAFDGYFIFGLMNEPMRLSLGAINLPWRTLLLPDEWNVVLHEVGHELNAIADPANVADLGASLSDITGVANWEHPSFPDIAPASDDVGFYWELISDYFEFALSASGDWDVYVANSVRSWLDLSSDQRAASLQETLIRFSLLEVPIPLDDIWRGRIVDRRKFEMYWQQLIDRVSVMAHTAAIPDGQLWDTARNESDDAFIRFGRWCNVHQQLVTHLRSRTRGDQLRDHVASLEAEAARVRAGETVAEPASGMALWKAVVTTAPGDRLPFNVRASLVLSMWSGGKRSSGRRKTAMLQPIDNPPAW